MKKSDGTIIPWSEMCPKDRFMDSFRHFPTILSRWAGGRARLEGYSVSLRQLHIRIEKDGCDGHLEIGCTATTRISSPTFWDNAQISIEPGEIGDRYVLSDDAACMRIVAGTCTVSEVG